MSDEPNYMGTTINYAECDCACHVRPLLHNVACCAGKCSNCGGYIKLESLERHNWICKGIKPKRIVPAGVCDCDCHMPPGFLHIDACCVGGRCPGCSAPLTSYLSEEHAAVCEPFRYFLEQKKNNPKGRHKLK